MNLVIMYFCESCEFGYTIPKTDANKRLLQLAMPCPNKDCDEGSIEVSARQEVKQLVNLSALVLYEACMGRGFPEEQVCSPEHLEHVLVGATIMNMDLKPAGTGRSFIESMTVAAGGEDGPEINHKVYFAMSVKGATIHKIQELTSDQQP